MNYGVNLKAGKRYPIFCTSTFAILPSSNCTTISITSNELSAAILADSFGNTFRIFTVLPRTVERKSFNRSGRVSGHDAEQNHFSKGKTGFVLAGLDTKINDFCGSVKMIVHDITPYSFVIRQSSCFEW